MDRHFFPPSHPRGPLHGGGHFQNYSSSSFQEHHELQRDLACFNDPSYGNGKRQRDSPVSSEGGEWQSSFKRLKVIDDRSSSPTEDGSAYSITTNHSSIESRFDTTLQTRPVVQEEHNGVPSSKSSPQQFVSQVPGEQSWEPSSGYQSMNSMLGQLHSLRQRRMEGAQPAAQHPVPMRETVPLAPPMHRTAPPRKGMSLRTSSKLY